GAMAAIAPIDVLDDLLAPLVLEVDVDVGRLAAVLRHEAGAQTRDLGRIHRGDAEAVADDAVCRRSAPLAEDVLAARKGDDVVHGEEVALEFELGDERELLADGPGDLVWDAVRI